MAVPAMPLPVPVANLQDRSAVLSLSEPLCPWSALLPRPAAGTSHRLRATSPARQAPDRPRWAPWNRRQLPWSCHPAPCLLRQTLWNARQTLWNARQTLWGAQSRCLGGASPGPAACARHPPPAGAAPAGTAAAARPAPAPCCCVSSAQSCLYPGSPDLAGLLARLCCVHSCAPEGLESLTHRAAPGHCQQDGVQGVLLHADGLRRLAFGAREALHPEQLGDQLQRYCTHRVSETGSEPCSPAHGPSRHTIDR